jgi:hypothetical protein
VLAFPLTLAAARGTFGNGRARQIAGTSPSHLRIQRGRNASLPLLPRQKKLRLQYRALIPRQAQITAWEGLIQGAAAAAHQARPTGPACSYRPLEPACKGHRAACLAYYVWRFKRSYVVWLVRESDTAASFADIWHMYRLAAHHAFTGEASPGEEALERSWRPTRYDSQDVEREARGLITYTSRKISLARWSRRRSSFPRKNLHTIAPGGRSRTSTKSSTMSHSRSERRWSVAASPQVDGAMSETTTSGGPPSSSRADVCTPSSSKSPRTNLKSMGHEKKQTAQLKDATSASDQVRTGLKIDRGICI